jgi:hypothetical protein
MLFLQTGYQKPKQNIWLVVDDNIPATKVKPEIPQSRIIRSKI